MAELVDMDDSISEIDAVEAQIEQPKVEVVDEDDGIPDHLKTRLKGKTRADIAQLVAEQEKMISRQGQEVGEIRKLADELLKQQLTKKQEVEQPKEVDFFENPQEAIRQAVESNPKVTSAQEYMLRVQQEQARQFLASKHPDFTQVVQDAEFAEWVKSSKVRTKLYQDAEAFDVDAADELLSTFKQLKAFKTPKVDPVEVEARKKVVSTASVDTSGTSESSKKTFRRADLIRLKLSDPRRYEAMQEDIDRAYQEGRVK